MLSIAHPRYALYVPDTNRQCKKSSRMAYQSFFFLWVWQKGAALLLHTVSEKSYYFFEFLITHLMILRRRNKSSCEIN